MSDSGQFQQQIQQTFQQRLNRHRLKVSETECLRMDLHCHDCNSDVTDELLGRILRFPETWLKTDDLVTCLKEHRCDVITITNHNNARSCWELMETGRDILPGGEFSCFFKKFDTHLHVPDLDEKRKQSPLSLLALEAIRSGTMHPYGQVFFHEKLNVAFMDYLSRKLSFIQERDLPIDFLICHNRIQ